MLNRRILLANESVTILTMTRHFDASAERVFDAWLNPDMMRKWLFSTEETSRICTNEPRVGGTWEITNHRDGADYRAIGEYLEIDRPSRLVFTFQMPQFSESTDRIVVEFKQVDKGCEMTFTQHIVVPHEEGWTPEDIEKALGEYHSGSEHGWNLMFIELKAIVES
jgi:uncharacterized protein YndB with AHSA1/START domain